MCAYKYELNVGGLEHIQIVDKIRYTFEIDNELEVASKEVEFGTRCGGVSLMFWCAYP